MYNNTAANKNLADQINRMVEYEEAKAITLWLCKNKAEFTMRLKGLMAEIESLLVNWRLTAFFHKDELKEDETIEDLGSRDLKKVSQLIIQLIREANAYSLLLGDEILTDIVVWTAKINNLIFDYEAVYIESKKINEAKPKNDNDRVTTINSLMVNEVDPKMKNIGETRTQIGKKLSKNVERKIRELANV